MWKPGAKGKQLFTMDNAGAAGMASRWRCQLPAATARQLLHTPELTTTLLLLQPASCVA